MDIKCWFLIKYKDKKTIPSGPQGDYSLVAFVVYSYIPTILSHNESHPKIRVMLYYKWTNPKAEAKIFTWITNGFKICFQNYPL